MSIPDDRVYRGVRIIQGLVNPHKTGIVRVDFEEQSRKGSWVLDVHAAFDWLSMEAFRYLKAQEREAETRAAERVAKAAGARPTQKPPAPKPAAEVLKLPRVNYKTKNKILHLAKKGYTAEEIAKALGYDVPVMRELLRQFKGEAGDGAQREDRLSQG